MKSLQNWLKTQAKNFFLTIKKPVKRWNQWVEVGGGGGGITVKSDIRFVCVYLQ
jgi:hypothetical protein